MHLQWTGGYLICFKEVLKGLGMERLKFSDHTLTHTNHGPCVRSYSFNFVLEDEKLAGDLSSINSRLG